MKRIGTNENCTSFGYFCKHCVHGILRIPTRKNCTNARYHVSWATGTTIRSVGPTRTQARWVLDVKLRPIKIFFSETKEKWRILATDWIGKTCCIGITQRGPHAETLAKEFAEHLFKTEGVRSEIFFYKRQNSRSLKRQYIWPMKKKLKYSQIEEFDKKIPPGKWVKII